MSDRGLRHSPEKVAGANRPGASARVGVLERLLAGDPIGRSAGAAAMKFSGWQRLNAEYAQQFGVEVPSWTIRS